MAARFERCVHQGRGGQGAARAVRDVRYHTPSDQSPQQLRYSTTKADTDMKRHVLGAHLGKLSQRRQFWHCRGLFPLLRNIVVEL